MGTRRRQGLAALLAIAVLATGCLEANPLPSPLTDVFDPNGSGGPETRDGGQGVVPTPDEYAYIQRSLTYVSSIPDDPDEDEASVVVLGAPGATSLGREIRIDVPDLNFERTVPRQEDGGFVTEVPQAHEGLEIVVELRGEPADAEDASELIAYESLTLVVRRADGDVPSFFYAGKSDNGVPLEEPAGGGEPSWEGDGAESFVRATAPDAQGMVHVRSDSLGVTPYAVMIVLNTDSGLSYVGQATADGALDIVLSGAVGDELHVFAARPAAPGESPVTTEAVVLIVPPV